TPAARPPSARTGTACSATASGRRSRRAGRASRELLVRYMELVVQIGNSRTTPRLCQPLAVRFIIYGAGGIGGVIGARLHQSGHKVVLIARGSHYEAIEQRGLRLQSAEEDVTLEIPVV